MEEKNIVIAAKIRHPEIQKKGSTINLGEMISNLTIDMIRTIINMIH